ncbi:MAG: hypothetical protein HY210_06570 [Candidatus Omnitrophica bacterium]|nr:hypothetical protein [Candidatus Omnitrophota bacterium]MBI5024834.1 hypothetical protein [Candidatus Omnitrophota bacterium]
MFFIKKCSVTLLVLCALSSMFLLAAGSPAFADGIVAIVNADNDISEISLSDLKKIYLMKKKKWPNGRDIMVWLPPSGGEEMTALLANVLKIPDEVDLKKYYLTAIFQQTIAIVPGSVSGGQEAARKVAGHEGGVAIVKESEILGSPGIKIVRIAGL